MKKNNNNSGEAYIGLIVLIFLLAGLMSLGPLVAMAKRNDDTAEMYLQDELNSFVNNAAAKGGFSDKELKQLQSDLEATNNSYELEMTISIASVNPAQKTDNTKIGDTLYYDMLNAQVLKQLNDAGVIILQEGDIIKVTAKNVNTTFYQMIRNILYGITGNEAYVQAAQASAICRATGYVNN